MRRRVASFFRMIDFDAGDAQRVPHEFSLLIMAELIVCGHVTRRLPCMRIIT